MLRLKATTWDVRKALVENQSQLIDCLMAYFQRRKFWSDFEARKVYEVEQIAEFNTLAAALGHPELQLDVPEHFWELLD